MTRETPSQLQDKILQLRSAQPKQTYRSILPRLSYESSCESRSVCGGITRAPYAHLHSLLLADVELLGAGDALLLQSLDGLTVLPANLSGQTVERAVLVGGLQAQHPAVHIINLKVS